MPGYGLHNEMDYPGVGEDKFDFISRMVHSHMFAIQRI